MGEQQEYYIGLDIGGTKCAVTLGKFEGDDLTIVDKIKFATNPEELQRGKRAPSEVLDEFVLQTQRLLAKHNGVPKRVGISCGGPLDSKRGIILSPPNCRAGIVWKLLLIFPVPLAWSAYCRMTRTRVLWRNGCSVQERARRI